MNVEDYTFPAYENVIRPLFDASIQAFVYRGTSEEHEGAFGELVGKPIDMKQEDILIPYKGKYRFDKTKECISGHEYIWHARSYKRGSIVLILPNDFDFSAVFTYCYSPSFDETPHMGQSPGAVKLCRETKDNHIAVIFSASNGIENMGIYASDETINKIADLAESLCDELKDMTL
ncbi:hypothetical protein C8Z91_16750 [Paenibacillus elgii]|uniref:Uncharacterized protein n=2 Tax=Paenibacillus elgii TaxID=189691 RepID=A0A2T6G1K4_9BACL|nr:hypothetical protein C8Z91_16750 [Paenibacillus elgii]